MRRGADRAGTKAWRGAQREAPRLGRLRPTSPRGGGGGFSLLEVLIAVAILAVVFAAVSGMITTGGFMQAKAPRYSQAALIIRSAVLDIEAHYREEGEFPADDVTREPCPEDPFDKSYTCEYDLEVLELEPDQLNQMVANLMEQLMASVGEGGNILQVLGFAWLFASDMPVGNGCFMTVGQFSRACGIDPVRIATNLQMTAIGIPLMVMEAAQRTRKLRLRVFHVDEKEEPLIEIETFITALPEESLEHQRGRKVGEALMNPGPQGQPPRTGPGGKKPPATPPAGHRGGRP